MIELTQAIRDDVNGALMSGHPMVFCAVTPEGLPTVSFRGTAQVFGTAALAIWVRKPQASTLIQSIAVRPTVVAVYSNLPQRRFYQFTGAASVCADEAIRQRVFDNCVEFERAQDPQRTGACVVIELSEVKGRGADGLFRLA
jgi:hypothetical protein